MSTGLAALLHTQASPKGCQWAGEVRLQTPQKPFDISFIGPKNLMTMFGKQAGLKKNETKQVKGHGPLHNSSALLHCIPWFLGKVDNIHTCIYTSQKNCWGLNPRWLLRFLFLEPWHFAKAISSFGRFLFTWKFLEGLWHPDCHGVTGQYSAWQRQFSDHCVDHGGVFLLPVAWCSGQVWMLT